MSTEHSTHNRWLTIVLLLNIPLVIAMSVLTIMDIQLKRENEAELARTWAETEKLQAQLQSLEDWITAHQDELTRLREGDRRETESSEVDLE